MVAAGPEPTGMDTAEFTGEEPFSPELLAIVLGYADTLSVTLMDVQTGTRKEHDPGGARHEDPKFLGQLCRVLTTGVPLEVLPRLRSATAIKEGCLKWEGFGKRFHGKTFAVPLDREMLEWLPGFLDQPKPKTRIRYYQLILQLQNYIERDSGALIKLSPSRFRQVVLTPTPTTPGPSI